MKRTITTALLALLGFVAQAQKVLPDAFTATGYIHYFPEKKELDYTSSASGVTRSVDNGALKITIPASASGKYTTIQTFDITDGSAATIDASSNKKLYVKMKATYGINVKAYPKYGNAGTTVSDYGYSKRQLIICSADFQWYLFDYSDSKFSDGNNMTEVSEITIEPDLGAENKDVVITIDSVLFGTTGITPNLPTPMVPTFYAQSITNIDYAYKNGTDTLSLVTGGIKLDFSEKDDAKRGVNFQINKGSGDAIFINLTDAPIVVISYTGATNDTLRCNLKYGSGRSLINNYAGDKKVDGSGTVSFDFSSLLDPKNEIIEIQLLLNPDNSESGSITITKLEAGIVTENCESAVAVNDPRLQVIEAKVYPNPVEVGASITISHEFETVEILNLNGTHIATLQSNAQTVNLPSAIKSGMYIMVMKGQENKAFAKFQVK